MRARLGRGRPGRGKGLVGAFSPEGLDERSADVKQKLFITQGMGEVEEQEKV